MIRHTTTEDNTLACGNVLDWREVLAEGTVKLSQVDGPYDMRKAPWDILTGAAQGFDDRLPAMVESGQITEAQADILSRYVYVCGAIERRDADLVAWYVPVLAEVSKASALSASVYLWNTDRGEALLRPVMGALGWTWRGCVRWDKGVAAMAGKVDTEGLRTWYDVTEACGFYQREEWAPSTCAGSEIAYAAGADDRNTARLFLVSEWEGAGLRRKEADVAMGTNGMSGHYFGTSQWALPTWEAYQALAAHAQEHGAPRERPYLVLPQCWPEGGLRASYDHLRASYDHLRASYDHLRAEYEASRPPFTAPLGISNVWSANAVSGHHRLKTADGETHPCQKPLDFAERILRASSNPGDLVVDWFSGTCRLAVANVQRLSRQERRKVVSIDMDPRWLDAAAQAIDPRASLASLGSESAPSLFWSATA